MMKSGESYAFIEELTEVIIKQSLIISRLCNVVAQLDAVTDFGDEIKEVQDKAREIVGEPE